MTQQYDGPSLFRHPSSADDDKINQSERQTLKRAKQTLQQVYVPPVMANKVVKQRIDFNKIIRQLHKQPGSYYLPATEVPKAGLTKNVAPKEADLKTSQVHKSNNKALGHSLHDILQGEQNSQRNLKIFDQK
ncbi:hypothetical protein [Paucilactobacillus wasatchensis]|uniref:Uncharacterized protein n=1 Tax=Paucilactobacillus wasatchensis TaxID=1335616 RepID=A0A0D1ABL8_9LACO|nr:hypothetical protein [Paucilactobacillus wasatchensis]KIS04071.1 hypothetical protein WDC_0273 [Paucilactobacillus wasatchensis]